MTQTLHFVPELRDALKHTIIARSGTVFADGTYASLLPWMFTVVSGFIAPVEFPEISISATIVSTASSYI